MRDPSPDPTHASRSRVPEDVDQLETEDIHHLHAPIMREQAEPRDGFEPVPVWLTIFYGAIVFWGGYYMASYNGGFRADVYDEHRPVATVASESKELDTIAQGGRLFTIHCAACHQRSGQGVAGQFPPLDDSEWVVGDYGRLIRILLHGLQGPVAVAGMTYNGNMPAFQTKLDDTQLAMVLTYIRQEWSNSAGPIPAKVIAELRGQLELRSGPWTAAELQGIASPPLSEVEPTSDSQEVESTDGSSAATESSDG